ncbi:hypothetical protein GGR58DRAFT_450685 [Xylaria digitata]|nr:hypothetical protein GGR58DRAFT_450685 [Xylaria digitata]
MDPSTEDIDRLSIHATADCISFGNFHQDRNPSRGSDDSHTRDWCSHSERRRENDEPHVRPSLGPIVRAGESFSRRWDRSELRSLYPSPPPHGVNRHNIANRLMAPLWLAAAATSFSSSLLVGESLVSYAGQGRRGFWRESQSSFHDDEKSQLKHCLEKVLLSQASLTLPPLPRMIFILHIFCLSTLALHRSRRSDRYQNEMIGFIVLIGLSQCLWFVSTEPCRDTMNVAIMTLPTLLSIGILFSAVFHIFKNFLDRSK